MKKWKFLAFMIVFSLVTVLISFKNSQAALINYPNKILFTSYRDGNAEIYSMKPDGSSIARLINNTAYDGQPSVSADTTKFVFVSDRAGNKEICSMNTDGTSFNRKTYNSANDRDPALIADGTKIAFVSDRDGNDEIYIMAFNGTGLTRLTYTSISERYPVWSPAGAKIAFAANNAIWVMNADGSNLMSVTNISGVQSKPSWSPQGDKIAFLCEENGNSEIYVINVNGSGLTKLTDDPASDQDPCWSPDGTKILFTSDRSGNNELYVMNAMDGSGVSNLSNHVANDEEPCWGGMASLTSPSPTIPPIPTPTSTTDLTYSVNINTTGLGTVTKSLNHTNYYQGDIIQLTAIPTDGWKFDHWEGDLTGSNSSAQLTVNGNINVKAVFIQIEYTINVNLSGNNGSVAMTPTQSTYHYGDTVTLTATPNAGWRFDHWEGDSTATNSTIQITIKANITILAVFVQLDYTFTYTNSGNGSVTTTPAQASYHYGDTITLTAAPNAGWRFDHWEGDVTGTDSTLQITFMGNLNVHAVFIQLEYTININQSSNISGRGSISIAPAQATYHHGDTLTLVATPETGWRFDHWEGEITGSNSTVQITFNGSLNIHAVFIQIEYTININQSSNITGSGSVAVTPAQTTYHYGDMLTLVATPEIGWRFDHWEGEVTGSNSTVQIIYTGNLNIHAVFIRIEYTININQSSNITGNGSIAITPAQATYHYGDTITLAVTPEVGWRFDHWEGDITGSNNTVQITYTGSLNVHAVFVRIEYTININQSSNTTGNGSIAIVGAQTTYHYGDIITLAVTPEVGWRFDHWEGDITGSTSTVQITYNGSLNVHAVFVQIEYTVNINQSSNISGNGSIAIVGGQATYHYGDTLTLTVIPEVGWRFDHWEGDITGSDSTVQISYTGSLNVHAVFVRIEYTVNINQSSNISGNGSIVIVGGQATYHYGDTLTLTVNPEVGWRFDHWEGDITGSDSSVQITYTGSLNIHAVFVQIEYTVNINQSSNISGNGSIVIVGGQATYHYGDTITLAVTPEAGWRFDHWEGDITGSNSTVQITYTGSLNVKAVFVLIVYIPQVPNNLKTIPTTTSISVSWDPVTGATGYDIEVDGGVFNNGILTNYVHSGLLSNTEHTYRVRAKNTGGTSEWSTSLTICTNVLSIPTNITASSITTSITVSWNLISEATGYDIEVDGNVTGHTSNTSYTSSGLTPGSQHTFRIRANNSGGVGGWSTNLTKNTVFLGVPTNLLSSSTSSSITLSWNRVTNATGYDIEADGSIIGSTSTLNFIHNGLVRDTSHSYRVRAKDPGMPGDWSEPHSASTFTSGTGTASDPYVVTTRTQLEQIENHRSAYYKLNSNIDLQNVEWLPVGDITFPFAGSLDGNGYKISNLKISKSDTDYIGLFGYINNATIKNLNISGINITGMNRIGTITGVMIGTSLIQDCSVTNGTVTGVGEYVGGMVGLIALLTTAISNSYTTVNVCGSGSVGGLAGSSYGSIMKCYATGNVTSSSSFAGGLVGGMGNNMSECYATGNVTGTDNSGGLIGGGKGNSYPQLIQDCFSLGSVTSNGQYVGGLIGAGDYTTVKNCYTAGKILGTPTRSGGIYGLYSISSSIINSYYDGITSGYVPMRADDVSRLTIAMKAQATFMGWDFVTKWAINEGSSYPYLRNLVKPAGVNTGLPTNEVAGGNGTVSNPYILSTLAQLNNIRYDLRACYKLGNGIDLLNQEWAPIGNSNLPFTGIFDGAGYTLSNLKISKSTTDDIGLFAYINNATIKNLNISGINVTGRSDTGAITGRMGGTSLIQYCSVTNGTVTGIGSVGGMVGYADSTITASTTSISNSYSKVNVSGSGTGCNVGGLVGISYGGIIKCYATGNVTASIYNVGGLAGNMGNTVSECYATGNVTGIGYAGGLIGAGLGINRPLIVQDCFSLGSVTTTISGSYVSGLVGQGHYTTVKNCYTSSKILGTPTSSGGLMFLYYSSSVTNSYFDSTQNGITTPTTQARTTSQLMQQSNFIGWDFTNVWSIIQGGSYPYLRNLPKP